MAEHRAGGVAGGVQNHSLGFLGNGGVQRLCVDLEAGLREIQMDGFRPGHGGDGFVEIEAGGGNNNFLARIQNAKQGGKQGVARADGDEHLIFRRGVAPVCFKFGHGPAQSLRTLIGRVVGLIGLKGGNGSRFNRFRGVEIRLTDGQQNAVRGLTRQIGIEPDRAALQGS